MIDRLQQIASRYRLGAEVTRELATLLELAAPRIPTVRLDDTNEDALPIPLTQAELEARYKDMGCIGLGGFSEVRDVWDQHVGRRVALKRQLPERSSDDDIARFHQEVRITARLQHPGIVPVYDWGRLPDGRIWFTMKRVNGETIGNRIAKLHALQGTEFLQTLRRLLDDYRRLCEPVAYAHAKHIIHRDLSPQNLMVGEFGEAHVMDWGLARDLSRMSKSEASADAATTRNSSDPSETRIRTCVAGTPAYMPPEQAYGEIASMGPASDVYTLGAVLYEVLSGQPPYVGRNGSPEGPHRVVERVRNGPPLRLESIARPEAPRELCALCVKAMERDPAARPRDAGALMEALRDWLDGADRRERARRIVEDADREHRGRIQERRGQAEERFAQAREILSRLRTFDPAQQKADGWKLEDEAAAIEQAILQEEICWMQKVRSALNEAPDLEEAHAALAEYYAHALLRADALRDEPTVMTYAALLEDHASKLRAEERSRYEVLLQDEGHLTLFTVPERVHVTIKPYELVSRYLMASDKRAIQTSTPVVELRLPRGSYLMQLSLPGYRTTNYPVNIGRGEHWNGIRPGEASPHPIRLLREDELGEDDIYVPAGWFVAGGDPRAGESLSRRRVWVDSFVVRKHPVTNREYLEFLNALVDEGRIEEARLCCPSRFPGALSNDNDPLAYLVEPESGRYRLRVPEAESNMPVVCIDWHCAILYAAYMARLTGLAWRLPSEFEWEKAARGVDGRFMPWGDQLEPTWATVAGSHPQRKMVMPVDRFPTDVSPYGVRGMAGNVRDWCLEAWKLDGPLVENGILQIQKADPSAEVELPIRGGAWISAGELMRLCIRYAEPATKRHGVLGFRLVRALKT